MDYFIFCWIVVGVSLSLTSILQTSFNKDMQKLWKQSPLPGGLKYFLMAAVLVYVVILWPNVMYIRYKRTGHLI